MGDQQLTLALPQWKEPETLAQARDRILDLGKTMHEHFYLTGKYLIWVKAKVGHGEFLGWLEQNINLFKKSTGEKMIDYSYRCDEAKTLCAYELIKIPGPGNLDSPPLPPGKYRVLYADPPWKYADILPENYGAATHHYPVLSIDELCDLKDKRGKSVADLGAENSVLFLWVTSPMLEEGPRVAEAWGFEYKASFVWDKIRHNYGHYNSVRHEFLLICTRGSCLPQNKELHDSVVSVERTAEHSEKPSYFRDLIDKMYPPNGRDRIELFARGRLPKHWMAWGNEVMA